MRTIKVAYRSLAWSYGIFSGTSTWYCLHNSWDTINLGWNIYLTDYDQFNNYNINFKKFYKLSGLHFSNITINFQPQCPQSLRRRSENARLMQDQIPLRKWMLVCCACWCCDGWAKNVLWLFASGSKTGHCSTQYSRTTWFKTQLRCINMPRNVLKTQQFVAATVVRRIYVVPFYLSVRYFNSCRHLPETKRHIVALH